MFGRKKKKESAVQATAPMPAAAAEEAEKKAQQVQETKETNRRLESARITKESIEESLHFLRYDTEFNNKVLKKALDNDAKVEKINAAKKAAEEEAEKNGTQPKKNMLYEAEEGMYIVSDDLDKYGLAIEAIENMFRDKSAVDTLSKGADRLNVLLEEYILKLQKALEKGRAKLAEACLIVLRYVLEVGYQFEDTKDVKKLQERLDKKLEFVGETGKQMIEVIDRYYSQLAYYETTERSYDKVYKEYMEKIQEVECIPQDISEKIDRLGFNRAMQELPPADSARKFLRIIMETRGDLILVYQRSMELEFTAFALGQLRAGYEEYKTECERAFDRDGNEFDYEAHQKAMFKIRKKSVDNINRIQDMIVANDSLNNTTEALLKEAAENPALGQAVSSSRESIRYFEKLRKQNEKLEKRIAALREENEKKGGTTIDNDDTENVQQHDVQDNEQEEMQVDA